MMKKVLFLFLALLLLSGCNRGADNNGSATEDDAPQLTVGIVYHANAVSIRGGPSMDYRIIDTVRRGGMCQIINYDEQQEWQEISYRGETAYISSEYLFAGEWESGSELLLATVASSNMVNVRAAADLNSAVLFQALKGEQYIVNTSDQGDGWTGISFPEGEGYIRSEFITTRKTTIDDALL